MNSEQLPHLPTKKGSASSNGQQEPSKAVLLNVWSQAKGRCLGQHLGVGTQTGSQRHTSSQILVLSALGTSVPHKGGPDQNKDSVALCPDTTVDAKIQMSQKSYQPRVTRSGATAVMAN